MGFSSEEFIKMREMERFLYQVPDYEHSGDLEWAKNYIIENFPYAQIIRAYEEEDYEQECDYENDYGECDEPIYQGFVEFEVPNDKVEEVRKNLN